jgi:RNA polymerase-binding transcription factor DksA
MKYPKNLLQPVLDYFRKLEQELLTRQGSLAKEDPYSDDSRFNGNASDDTEAADQDGHARSEALSKETKIALTRVRAAMLRVEGGTYGACVRCGKMVDTDRLRIDPTAELCVTCAKNAK